MKENEKKIIYLLTNVLIEQEEMLSEDFLFDLHELTKDKY